MSSKHPSAEDGSPKEVKKARGRIFSKHTRAQDARPKNVNKAPMSAEPKVVEEVEDDEEQKREAELRRAQDQFQKCLAHKDYMGAATAKNKIDALMSAVCSKAESSAATATGQETQLATDQAHSSAASVTGQGSQPVTGPAVTSRSVARGAAAKCVEKNAEEEEKLQAELRRAQHQLNMCLEKCRLHRSSGRAREDFRTHECRAEARGGGGGGGGGAVSYTHLRAHET